MAANFLSRNRSIILYGVSLAVLLLLMKWLEWHFIVLSNAFEIYAGLIAVIFTLLGIWLALKLARPKTVIVEREVVVNGADFIFNEDERVKLGLSKREMEVLQLMADGLSNEEIAARLFVSLNTIKTHSSKVFEKLEVRRRTHAVDKARKLQLIP
ncbi:helix-turn-helix transcriptional regulator [Mucilaginibacter sp. BJC16-A38]|uniref:helix-turn-helix transcriptional regulator n=1 Tax=Mucilaginibacter phenanthrenivorans TaxID=1234842 RepID=UPI00215754DA|nr:helix-turn-helix transcriptional regulator [Mucilaginibacter phenanthrenivorans]MCR8557616.1 helix-turn-helix transcriptional regulator [Mucilaginibacter phenanthrenivorans]